MSQEIHPHQLVQGSRRFSQRLSPTRRGARLARLLAVQQLADWGWDHNNQSTHTAALLVAELAANAVQHGRVPGRDFLLALVLATPESGGATLRIEVADCRDERLPLPVSVAPPGAEDEHGRGLLLVESLATRWGVDPRHPCGKTVWAEIQLSPGVPS
ncbi:ATP-binding protein [Streptomyces iranensis]|uniref:Anti-sigma regulatory factor (Ser/Thr protein kinase) n=1 Tax=Streptomyces iranensis TaxID=576784 RepID=A0A060ZKD8_9ACTN|nr:ATP-binding protein [Streptomyces iranensis]MBP2064050.1 anti-sigma regulatory factor (Ser/Thr protein kinase) [Streptomyces iranensis]CDR06545.1 regulatory protein [Streptomyces iranensis]